MILHGCLNVAGSEEHGGDDQLDEREDAPGDEQGDEGARGGGAEGTGQRVAPQEP
jgi:hypothetical protein